MLLAVLGMIALASVGGWILRLAGQHGRTASGTQIRMDEVLIEDDGGRSKLAVIDI